jgi:hypothetical protein
MFYSILMLVFATLLCWAPGCRASTVAMTGSMIHKVAPPSMSRHRNPVQAYFPSGRRREGASYPTSVIEDNDFPLFDLDHYRKVEECSVCSTMGKRLFENARWADCFVFGLLLIHFLASSSTMLPAFTAIVFIVIVHAASKWLGQECDSRGTSSHCIRFVGWNAPRIHQMSSHCVQGVSHSLGIGTLPTFVRARFSSIVAAIGLTLFHFVLKITWSSEMIQAYRHIIQEGYVR